jgi:hypothetical protein
MQFTGLMDFQNFVIAISELVQLDDKPEHHGVLSILSLNKESHILIHNSKEAHEY